MGEKTKIKTAPSRNYSLDLLRIISMFMVVCLHILGHGHVFENTEDTVWWYPLEFIWAVCVVAVNLYVLLSSYFLINQKFRPSKLIHLYLEVVFWSLSGWIFAIAAGMDGYSTKTLIFDILLPVSSKKYWFISAYFVLYILMPVLNFFIKKLTKRQHLAVCFGLLFVFSILVEFFPRNNVFDMDNGYSFHWLIVLYFIGSYLRLHADPKKWKLPGVWYLVAVLVSLGVTLLISLSPIAVKEMIYGNFANYNSINVVIESVLLFIAFLKFDLKGKIPQKIIGFIAPLTFGVYLIHENGYFRGFLWQNIVRTQDFPYDSILLIPITLGMVILVFLSCVSLDFLRSLVFSLWEKRKFWRNGLEKFDKFVVGTLYKVTDRILEGKKE